MAQQFDPNTAGNLPEIEKQIAVRCVEHAQTYWNLLEKIPGSRLRLTKFDADLMADFEATFPELAGSDDGIRKIDEQEMKSTVGKKKWREFILKYEQKIADFNFGTLIRTDATQEYTQLNTIFVTRFQFYIIEIARCRRGMNDWVYENAHK
ncbi:D-lactate dehydrogenase (cytochrome) [Malassezia cuniculi]|uniref:D-lactate dehydrogenase (Cytochrome) n=1 Tax=Malassezia cuniculi TaxID=948313 RepID=A0AAF0EYB1_9BASI|nr:D-lactate dehydrogenase (cytochrome) [Malassezia cuniculi]